MSKEALKRGPVHGEERRAHLPAIPLAHRMRPEGFSVSPGAQLEGWRDIGNMIHFDPETLEQSGGIAAKRDPGADLSKLRILLKDLDMNRSLQERPREG